jgi:hypothetical protein
LGLRQALRRSGLRQAAEQVSSVVMSMISIRNPEETPDDHRLIEDEIISGWAFGWQI